ncbi:quinoprotein dehydrogenase-associated putative ABC transporter substrate-binding protein [Hyphomicrobium sp. ghe19]|uniref:quinoprotein dehydrogenase-associated putative ABC transporter substrate-binding protein n=1 Tax=Hyphomicrobium sp. ghe19 TaxID=2682968 RepID=UPI00136698E8|nr:Actin-binding protein [Hyphomicrobium sp. ghe19]
MAGGRSRKRPRSLLVYGAALALSALSVAGQSALAADALVDKDKLRLETALAHLEAQMPLTSADHNALKKAATERQVPGLRVCGDPGNLPLSDIKRAGFENKIIELIAAEMGTYVTYFWRPYLERGITRQTFESGDCDVLLDLPVGFERVLTTEPIYRTTYVLAYRSDRGLKIKNLDDPQLKTLKIGTFQTSGLRMALAERGIRSNVELHVLSHNSDLDPNAQPWRQVQEVLDGKLDVAAVWGPFAGWLKTMKGQPLVIQPVNLDEDDVPLEFDLTIGLRKIDWILKYKFDLALDAKKAEIEKILRDYGVPLVQCSRCFVAGDLPSHGTYTKPVEDSKEAHAAIAPDQKVTRERLEAWLKDGADLNQELSNAVLANDGERIAFLIDKGADVNKLNSEGYAPLHVAARNERPEIILALVARKADVNIKDRDGYTPLQHAVLRNSGPVIEALGSHGGDLEALTPTGVTPLALAILESKYKAAIALINVGANVETADGDAKLTPLMLISGSEERELTLSAGVSRIEKANPTDPGPIEVARAMIAKGAKVNDVSGTGVTALLLAAAHNNAPIVGLLAQAGADQNFKSPQGQTAADLARQNGNTSVVGLLNLLSQSGSN